MIKRRDCVLKYTNLYDYDLSITSLRYVNEGPVTVEVCRESEQDVLLSTILAPQLGAKIFINLIVPPGKTLTIYAVYRGRKRSDVFASFNCREIG